MNLTFIPLDLILAANWNLKSACGSKALPIALLHEIEAVKFIPELLVL